MTRSFWATTVVVTVLAASAVAHDTWVQPNTNLVRTGDAVHIDLMLANHGNDHRDFKLASKVSQDQIQTFAVIAPDGKKYDLKTDLTDMGYAPKEGYYSAKFVPRSPGYMSPSRIRTRSSITARRSDPSAVPKPTSSSVTRSTKCRETSLASTSQSATRSN